MFYRNTTVAVEEISVVQKHKASSSDKTVDREEGRNCEGYNTLEVKIIFNLDWCFRFFIENNHQRKTKLLSSVSLVLERKHRE